MKFRTSRLFLARLASRRSARVLQAALLLTFGAVSATRAANDYWDPTGTGTGTGSGGTGIWNTTSTFWHLSGGTGDAAWPNTTANTADFAGTAGTVTLGSNITAGGLIFDTTGYTLATSTFTLSLDASGITQNVAAATISGAGTLSLTANQSWTVASGGTLTVSVSNLALGTNNLTISGAGNEAISSVIAGSGGLVMNGTGTLSLSGASTFTGGVTLNSGTVALVNAGTNLGAAPASPTVQVTFGGNSTLQIGNNALVANRNIQINSGVTGTIDTGTGNTAGGVAGVISGAGNFIKTGTSPLALSGANTYTGTSAFNAGTTTLTGGISSSSAVSVSGGTLNLDYSGTVTNKIGDTSSVTVSRGGLFAMVSTPAATTETIGTLGIDTGSSTVSVTASNNTATLAASGFSRANNATSLIRGSNLGQGTSTAEITLASLSGLTLVGTNTLAGATSGDTTQALRIVPYFFGGTSASSTGTNFVTYDTTYGLRVLTASEQTILAAGTTTAANPVNALVTSGVTVGAGLTVNSLLFTTAASTLTGSGVLTVNSGAVADAITGVNSAVGNGFTRLLLGNGEGVLTTIPGANLYINTPLDVSGGGGLTVTSTGTGTGLVVLQASALYTGQTTINSGNLYLGGGNTVGDLGSNTAAIVDNGTLTFNHSNALSLVNNISGTGGVSQIGAGNTTLSGTNTYTGTTLVNNGTLTAGGASSLPAATTISFNSGSAALNLGGNAFTLANLTVPSATAGITATVTNGSLSLGSSSFNFAPTSSTNSTTTTLDLTGLTSFTYAQAAAGQSFNITLGASATTNTAAATLNLAAGTNSITVTSIGIGNGGSAGIGGVSTLNLGAANTINTNSIQLSGYRSVGATVQFESGLTSPTLTLRGLAGGVTPVGTITLGQTASGGTVNTTLFDTSAGSINGIVNNLVVGQVATTAPGTGTNSGTFRMQTGTLNTGTITLASIASSITGAVSATTDAGTFTQNAGAVLADNIVFNSQVSGNGTNITDTGVYNLGTSTTTGLLSVASISLGSAVANTASRATLNFNNGTITNYDNTANGFNGQGNANGTATNVANLILAGTGGGGGAVNAATLNIVLASTGTHNFFAESGQSITEASTAIITGTGGLTVNGPGTVIFNGANTYTGATNINAGTLDLGGSTANGSVSSSSALVMGGGTLNYTRTGGTTQTFNGTTFNSGGSTINVAAGDTLALGAITRNPGGTAFLGTTGTITTTTANGNTTTANTGTNGFLGAYAVYGSYDWASNNGGSITYFAGYTTYNNVASVPANVDLTDNGNGYDGTATGGATTVNSMRFNEGNADSTINLGGNLTISSGGILVTPNLGVKFARINGTGLTTTASDLVVQQQNTGGGRLQIGSSIFGAIGLTKAGPGQLDINGTSASYTGATTVNGGTLFIQATTAVGGSFGLTGTSSVIVNNSGTVLLGGSNQINSLATVTLNGGTINTGGYSQGTASGGAAATQGLGALTLSSSSTLDFGAGHAGSSVLAFAASNGQTWNGTLTLTDFTPGTDYLNFATGTGLTPTQLGEISLVGFSASGLDSFGNIVFTAVPEPATWAAGVLLLGAAGWTLRRRTVRRTA